MARRRLTLKELLCTRTPGLDSQAAFALIACGQVVVAGERVRDPSRRFDIDEKLEILESPRYVSRGAEKLAGPMQRWRIPISGRVWLDAGASTGGFTDYLLRFGARFVHAVDVGYNQLDYSLRRDPRVGVHERTNIRDVQKDDLVPSPDAAVVDLSFRSLRGVAGLIISLTNDRLAVALAKPQFEWRNPPPDFDGVVGSRDACRQLMEELIHGLHDEGVVVLGILPSPIRGRRGNAEFFVLLSEGPTGGRDRVSSSTVELEQALDEVFA